MAYNSTHAGATIDGAVTYGLQSTGLAQTDKSIFVGSTDTRDLLETTATCSTDGNMVAESYTANAFNGNDAIVDNGNSSAAATISWNNGNYQKITLTSTEVTITFSDPVSKIGICYIEYIQDATGNRVVTYSTSNTIRTGGGFGINTANSDANEIDVVTYIYDGTNYNQISLDYDMK